MTSLFSNIKFYIDLSSGHWELVLRYIDSFAISLFLHFMPAPEDFTVVQKQGPIQHAPWSHLQNLWVFEVSP